MNTLTVTATSARALAAARPGGEVVVRVAMEPQPPEGYDYAKTLHRPVPRAVFKLPPELGVWWADAPAAAGERVAMECPACTDGEMYCGHVDGADLVATCGVCGGHGTLPATVTAAPEPETFCGTCEGEGYVRTGEVRAGVCVNINGEWWHERCEVCAKPCPTCRGTPSTWVWRVGVRREEA